MSTIEIQSRVVVLKSWSTVRSGIILNAKRSNNSNKITATLPPINPSIMLRTKNGLTIKFLVAPTNCMLLIKNLLLYILNRTVLSISAMATNSKMMLMPIMYSTFKVQGFNILQMSKFKTLYFNFSFDWWKVSYEYSQVAEWWDALRNLNLETFVRFNSYPPYLQVQILSWLQVVFFVLYVWGNC